MVFISRILFDFNNLRVPFGRIGPIAAGAVLLAGQTNQPLPVGPTNLSFTDILREGGPSAWISPGTGVEQGRAPRVETADCQNSARCASFERALRQTFDASKYRGRTVALSAWVKSVAGPDGSFTPSASRLQIAVLHHFGNRTVFQAQADLGISEQGWRRQVQVIMVPFDAERIEIGCGVIGPAGTRGWISDVTFHSVDPVQQSIASVPPEIRSAYRAFDRHWTRSKGEGPMTDVSHMLLNAGRSSISASDLPFDNRLFGVEDLVEAGSAITAATNLVDAAVVSSNYWIITSNTSVTRSDEREHREYEIRWHDLWTATSTGWKLADEAPESIRSVPGFTVQKDSPDAFDEIDMPPCGLFASQLPYSEGATDYTRSPKPRGVIKTAAVFVDFPEALGTEYPGSARFQKFLDGIHRWSLLASFGAWSVETARINHWVHMPRPSNYYEGTGPLSLNQLVTFRDDVLAALQSNGEDVSNFDALYVISPPFATLQKSHAVMLPPDVAAKSRFRGPRHFARFGNDIYAPWVADGLLGGTALHETAHIFGLPDLYQGAPTRSFRTGDGGLGAWDLMSEQTGIFPFSAWHRAKLGLLDARQVKCITAPSTETITPVATASGLKALVIPTEGSKALVVEAREAVGLDAPLCAEGVLIYAVNTQAQRGEVPMRLVGGTLPGQNFGRFSRCGNYSDAPLHLLPGRPRRFEDPASGVSIELKDARLGKYTVAITRSSPWSGLQPDTQGIKIWSQTGSPAETRATIGIASGAEPILFSAAASAPWLTVSPQKQVTPYTVTISATAKSLPPGLYEGEVRLLNAEDPARPTSVKVRFRVAPASLHPLP